MASPAPPPDRRTLALRVGVSALLVLALALGGGWWVNQRIQRFDPAELELDQPGELPPDPFADQPTEPVTDGAMTTTPVATEPPDRLGEGVRTYLVYSTGSAGMTREEAARFGVADLGSRGGDGLTDVMLVILVDDITRQAAMLSIPRDTWVSSLGMRVNSVLARRGLQQMVDTVTQVTGLPVNHLVEVNFTAFAELVEVLGGVPVEVDAPLRDWFSGLWLPDPGCVLMDPLTALAYVRSRHTETRSSGGSWRVSGELAGDFGRTERQRAFLAAAWDDIRGPGLITQVPSLFGVLTRNVTIDEGIGLGQVQQLAGAFQGVAGGAVESYLLPADLGRAGAASVVRVNAERARPILHRLRNWPPPVDPASTPSPVPPTATPTPTPPPVTSPPLSDTPAVTPGAAAPTAPPTEAAPGWQPGQPCTRAVATPAPGTPPPGTPPQWVREVDNPTPTESVSDEASPTPTGEVSDPDELPEPSPESEIPEERPTERPDGSGDDGGLGVPDPLQEPEPQPEPEPEPADGGGQPAEEPQPSSQETLPEPEPEPQPGG